MSIVTRSRITLVRVMLLTITATACSEAAGVGGDYDPRVAADAVETMASVGTNTEDAFSSLALASADVFEGTTGAALVPLDPQQLSSADAHRLLALQSQPFFPSNALGMTFVYDEAEGGYVASDETGAPSDGVRVIYYAVDPISQEPASPLNALGYIDVRDLGGASSERAGILIVRTSGAQNVTLADYYIDVAQTATSSSAGIHLTAPGYISNGAERLDFALSSDLLVSESRLELEQDHSMALAGGGPSVAMTGVVVTDFDLETFTYDLTSTIESDAGRVIFVLSVTGETLEGEVLHNSTRVATIGGTLQTPTFTDAQGESLDAAERESLSGLFDGIDALVELAEGIFATGPAE